MNIKQIEWLKKCVAEHPDMQLGEFKGIIKQLCELGEWYLAVSGKMSDIDNGLMAALNEATVPDAEGGYYVDKVNAVDMIKRVFYSIADNLAKPEAVSVEDVVNKALEIVKKQGEKEFSDCGECMENLQKAIHTAMKSGE